MYITFSITKFTIIGSCEEMVREKGLFLVICPVLKVHAAQNPCQNGNSGITCTDSKCSNS